MVRIYRIHRKPETPEERGLPKVAVEEARVTAAGLEGDFNRFRQERRGGDPDAALLLLPLETLGELNREGWPVRPGDLGENLTIEGGAVELEPGVRLRVGSELEIEVSRRCDPCAELGVLPYVGPERVGEFVRVLRGRRGWYARVRRPGRVRAGDGVEEI